MGLVDRIKRRLPMFGQPETQRPPPRPRPTFEPDPEPAAPVSVRGSQPVPEFIEQYVKQHPVVLFMKGDANFPQCGFSGRAIQVLKASGVDVKGLKTINVLEEPEIRQGIKEYSNWPTIPQLYVKGEFIGGSDIMMEMFESGELTQVLKA
jgi:monothiol glutaredoxin